MEASSQDSEHGPPQPGEVNAAGDHAAYQDLPDIDSSVGSGFQAGVLLHNGSAPPSSSSATQIQAQPLLQSHSNPNVAVSIPAVVAANPAPLLAPLPAANTAIQPQVIHNNAGPSLPYNPTASGAANVIPQPPKTRISQACDQCFVSKARCDTSFPCPRCRSLGIACTKNRPKKRRGPPNTLQRPGQNTWATGASSTAFLDRLGGPMIVQAFIDDYFTHIYPLFPLPPQPWFMTHSQQGPYEDYPKFQALTAAMMKAVLALGLRPDKHAYPIQSAQAGPLARYSLIRECQRIINQALASDENPQYTILDALINFLVSFSEELMQNELANQHLRGLSLKTPQSRIQFDVQFSACLAIVNNIEEATRPFNDFPPMEPTLLEDCGRRLFWIAYSWPRSWDASKFHSFPALLIPHRAGPQSVPLPYQSDELELFKGNIAEGTTSVTQALIAKVHLLQKLEPLHGMDTESPLTSFDLVQSGELVEHALLGCKDIDFPPSDKPESYLQLVDFHVSKLRVRSLMITYLARHELGPAVVQTNGQPSSSSELVADMIPEQRSPIGVSKGEAYYDQLMIAEGGSIVTDLAHFILGLDWIRLEANATLICKQARHVLDNVTKTAWGRIQDPPLDLNTIQQTEQCLRDIEDLSVERIEQRTTAGPIYVVERNAILRQRWSALVQCQSDLLAKAVAK